MIQLKKITKDHITINWNEFGDGNYRILWSNKNLPTSHFIELGQLSGQTEYTLHKATHVPHYLRIISGDESTPIFTTPVHYHPAEQIEDLDRGLVAVKTDAGIFLSWRLLLPEVVGFDASSQSQTGVTFDVYRNDDKLASVTNSTNYLDTTGEPHDRYAVISSDGDISATVVPWQTPYFDIPLKKPAAGVTPAGESYDYHANDLSVADIDGDGEYEFILKWDPSNSHDVSHRGYTGNCYLDCYKMNGRHLWRIDCGVNIRSGAHYTQFICLDFDGDGKSEITLKTAPGTKVIHYNEDGTIASETTITIPQRDLAKGITHDDNYVCSGEDFQRHLQQVFQNWHQHPEVLAGHWPRTLEACFGIADRYPYPLAEADALALTDYFLDTYAPSRSEKNLLRQFEGFIYEGPEYLTMFAGDGHELSTIDFPFPRGDDGLLWGDYAWKRIEPCNRVDRFLAGAAYLDGQKPSLIICRGYYTRACVAAFDFSKGHFNQRWKIDSGHVPMNNPFNNTLHNQDGTHPLYGSLASQGDHSLACADVDGDGKMEIIYGGATIDHDGRILYSSKDRLPDGRLAKLNHGDAMHVADIDPDRPGYEIFNVFEEAAIAPYGYALRRAEDGTVIFGEFEPVRDLGRAMIGDISDSRGYQCWVNTIGTFNAQGEKETTKTLGTNFSIRFAADCSTQVLDGVDYLDTPGIGIINDWRKGVLLTPENTATNNGTKGNPCLVADIFGDYREELILRTADDSALRIYTSTELSQRKLMTLMHDVQYRCGVAWQNNCYNQPCYPKFYYGSDMDSSEILPHTKAKPTFYLTGDSTLQSYDQTARPQFGWGEKILVALYPTYSINVASVPEAISPATKYENQHIIIDNRGIAGRSTKSFLAEKRLEPIASEIKTGDYLLIQFGHNDVNQEKPDRYTTPEEYRQNLLRFIDVARWRQATPVLLSPIALSPAGIAADEELADLDKQLASYREIMAELAETEKVAYWNIHRQALRYFNDSSLEDIQKLYLADHVHLTEKGADFYSKLIANSFRESGNWFI